MSDQQARAAELTMQADQRILAIPCPAAHARSGAARRWRRCGRAAFAHVETWRPYTLFYAGFVSLAGALLTVADPGMWRLAGAWAVPTLYWVAALYGGDYVDRHLDAIAKPHRPIPSGRMSPRAALAGMATCLVAGAAIAVALNPLALLVVAAAIVLALSYSAIFKARGGLGNVVRGGPMALVFVFGAMATGTMPPLELLPLALVFWLHDACSNLVGTLRDIDGDRAGGCGTLAVRRGADRATGIAASLYGASVALALAWPLAALDGVGLTAYLPLLGVAAALSCLAFSDLVRAGAVGFRATALRAHEVLVVERLVLAAAFVAAAGAVMPAFALLAGSALATVVLQASLRARHERTADDGIGSVAAAHFAEAAAERMDRPRAR